MVSHPERCYFLAKNRIIEHVLRIMNERGPGEVRKPSKALQTMSSIRMQRSTNRPGKSLPIILLG
jgi:hypothetical protein